MSIVCRYNCAYRQVRHIFYKELLIYLKIFLSFQETSSQYTGRCGRILPHDPYTQMLGDMDDLEKIFRKYPLSAFSVYTQVQADYLVRLGRVLCEKFDSYGTVINDFNDTYGKFWLWVLGSYEVIRTLSQYSDSFDPAFATDLDRLKKYLAEVRMPFAKQEYRGRSENIRGDLSVVSMDKDHCCPKQLTEWT